MAIINPTFPSESGNNMKKVYCKDCLYYLPLLKKFDGEISLLSCCYREVNEYNNLTKYRGYLTDNENGLCSHYIKRTEK